MKAKEWAAKLEAGTTQEEMLKEFGQETAELVAARTKTSTPESKLPAAEGAVREQQNKFRAICQKVPALNEAKFNELLAEAVPNYAKWQAEAEKKKKEAQPSGEDVRNYRKQKRRA